MTFTSSRGMVSIITPAYRAAKTIDATIESVLAQSYQDWEMLIAEDCGPDDTRDLVAAWSKHDPRIRLIALEQNGGPATARNRAIERARGRWLAFLDADDLWLPDKLERQLAFHDVHPGAVLTFTGYRRISEDDSIIGRYIGVPHRLTYRQLLGNTAIMTSSVLIDRDISGPVEMERTYYDDFACWLALLKPGRMAYGFDQDLLRYRVLKQSVSRDKRNSVKQVWLAYRRVHGLGLVRSTVNFVQYAGRAWLKYRRF